MQSNNKLLWRLFGNLACLLYGFYLAILLFFLVSVLEGLRGGGELEPPAPAAERLEALNDAVFNGEDAADDGAEGDGGELEPDQEPNQQEEPEPNQGRNQEEEPEPEGLNQEEGLEQQPLQQFRQHLQELDEQQVLLFLPSYDEDSDDDVEDDSDNNGSRRGTLISPETVDRLRTKIQQLEEKNQQLEEQIHQLQHQSQPNQLDVEQEEPNGDGGDLELNQEPNQQEEPEPNQGRNQEEEPEPEGLNQEEGLEQQPLQQFRQHLQELVQQGGNVRDIVWYTTLVRILERRGNGDEMTSTDKRWLHNQRFNYKNEGSRGLQVGGPRRRDLELSGLLNMRV